MPIMKVLPAGTRWSYLGVVAEAREPMYLRPDGNYSAPARVSLADGVEHVTGLQNQHIPASWIHWADVKPCCACGAELMGVRAVSAGTCGDCATRSPAESAASSRRT
jgi:hypothetical protein